jgi:cbb3-type cytochrome oxidase subunit 3
MRQLFEATPGWAAILSTVGFTVLFAGIIWYVLIDRRRGHHQRMSAMPLDIEEKEDRHG